MVACATVTTRHGHSFNQDGNGREFISAYREIPC